MEGTMTLATIFENVTTGVTAAAGWAGTYADTIAEHPMLFAGVILGFIGFGVGILKRLFNI